MNRKKWWAINIAYNKVLKHSGYVNYMSFGVGLRVPQKQPCRVAYGPDRDLY